MARQGGRVQLEQSDLRLACNMANMGKRGFSRTAIDETQYLIKKPRAEVGEEMKRSVEFPGQEKLNPVRERHPAVLRQSHTAGCLPCQNGTVNNLQTCWCQKRAGAPPPNRRRQPTPEPTSLQPGTPPALTGHTSGAQRFQIVNLPAGYGYSHTSLPCAEF